MEVNFVFHEIVSFNINITKYLPIKGKGYLSLADFDKNKKSNN